MKQMSMELKRSMQLRYFTQNKHQDNKVYGRACPLKEGKKEGKLLHEPLKKQICIRPKPQDKTSVICPPTPGKKTENVENVAPINKHNTSYTMCPTACAIHRTSYVTHCTSFILHHISCIVHRSSFMTYRAWYIVHGIS